MFKNFDTTIIDNYIKEKFPIIYDFDFNGRLLLYGGTIRDLMLGKKESKDLDFALLTQKKPNIKEFIDKYNIKVIAKINYGYKLEYKGTMIDIIALEDLCYCSSFNIQFLYYDIKNKILIPIGIKRAIEKNIIIKYFHRSYRENKRKKIQAKEFLTFLNNKKHHRIKYKYSRLKCLLKKLKELIFNKKQIKKSSHFLKDVDTTKIDKLIKEKFPMIYDFKFDGLILLYGGAVRSTIAGEKIRDLDFVLLTEKENQIEEFISKYNLKYRKNFFDGFKIDYNNVEIDIYDTNDLLSAATYDVDLLFYDIHDKNLIVCGPIRAYENRTITEINSKERLTSDKFRTKKLVNYLKYITKSNKKVKVKENKIRIFYKERTRKLKRLKRLIKEGNFRKCFKFLSGCKKEFSLILLIGLLISLIASVTPALSGNLIEKIISKGLDKIIYIIVIMVILKILSVILSYFFNKLYLRIKKVMVFNIRKETFSNIINFEMSNFSNNSSGSFINKIKDDSNDIARCFNQIKDILVRGITNIWVIVYIFYLNWIIGIILSISMYIIYKIKMTGAKKKLRAKRKILSEQEKYASMLNEMVNGIRDIKVLDLKENYMNITIEKFKEVSELEYSGDNQENIYNKIANLCQFAMIGIILLIGIILIKNNILSPSKLVIIYMYKSTVFSFLDRFVSLMNIRLNFNLACTRIFSLLDENKFAKEKYGTNKLTRSKGIIEFKNVSFKYDSTPVLVNCSFKVGPHDVVAIVGPSGAGKTTILNLIAKLYKPQKGLVLIDNTDINTLSYEYIKNTISVVSQTPYLFDMSIKDNLRLVKLNITDKEIKKVCKKLCLDEFICSLPNQYDTIIGEGGITLSQGQKQRLGIARALIRNTPIILLDEITSALDKDTGNNIKQIINEIKKEHTIIIVSHDLSFLEGFKVLNLKNGKLS